MRLKAQIDVSGSSVAHAPLERDRLLAVVCFVSRTNWKMVRVRVRNDKKNLRMHFSTVSTHCSSFFIFFSSWYNVFARFETSGIAFPFLQSTTEQKMPRSVFKIA